jgi:hypothetical protein
MLQGVSSPRSTVSTLTVGVPAGRAAAVGVAAPTAAAVVAAAGAAPTVGVA